MDEYEVKVEGDIYEVLEEDEYRDLVEKRRQREDFVVDDGEFEKAISNGSFFLRITFC